MVVKLLVAGAIGATLLTIFQSVGMNLSSSSCAAPNVTTTLLTGFGIGAGVQAGVMLLGVS